jgi:DNA-binding PadR family transcriptional regulator
MNVPGALLGLLEPEPTHGYELKHSYDRHFGTDRRLPYGQVYATLARLERDGRVKAGGTEAGGGPERKLYAITEAGVTALDTWLGQPEQPEPHLQPVLFAKVVLALLSGRPAGEYLDRQRAAHLQRMREVTAGRERDGLAGTLVADYALFHLEADLRWIDLTVATLGELAQEVTR